MIEAIGSIVAILTIAIGLSCCISKINYAIDTHYLKIKVGRISFRRIPITDFNDAEVGVTTGGENWTNTLNIRKIREEGVTLHRRTGLFRRLNITPDDPAEFVQRIKSHPRYRPSQ